jgi:hypothetical protein
VGWLTVMAPCVVCRQVFTFSPSKVPSVVVNGEREPVCESCVTLANEIRLERGLTPFEVRLGAYEPDSEDEW